MTEADIERLRTLGLTDAEILDPELLQVLTVARRASRKGVGPPPGRDTPHDDKVVVPVRLVVLSGR